MLMPMVPHEAQNVDTGRLTGSRCGDQEQQQPESCTWEICNIMHGGKKGTSSNGSSRKQDLGLAAGCHGHGSDDDSSRRESANKAEGAPPSFPREAEELRSRGSGWPFSRGLGSIYSAVRKMHVRSRKPANDADAQTGFDMPVEELAPPPLDAPLPVPAPAAGGDVSPVHSMEGSERGVAAMREMFANSRAGGINKDSSKMRQESYYLRGKVEEVKDGDFLDTIKNCIPGELS